MSRDRMIHELKCWPPYFRQVADENKPFEVRPDDRDFQVGDFLWLREWDPTCENYTGQEVSRQITCRTEKGSGWVKEGFVVLGLQAIHLTDGSQRTATSPSWPPRYLMTMNDWELITAAARPAPKHSYRDIAREVNTTIRMAEESLRKAIATDLRSMGRGHPELAAWAETLACRYARGEEAT